MSLYRSCDPSGLYANGGFPGPPGEYAALVAGGAAGEFVAEVFPAFGYARPLGAELTLASPAFAAQVAEVQGSIDAGAKWGAPCRLYRIPDAILHRRVIATDVNGEVRAVYETHRPQDRASLTLGAPDALRAAPRWGGSEPLYLFLGSAGSFNYGHWLVDDLPRVAAVAALRERRPGRPVAIVLAGHDLVIDAIRRQSIELVLAGGPVAHVVFVPDEAVLRFEELYFATPITVHPGVKSPDALRWLRRRLLDRTRGLRAGLAFDRVTAKLAKGDWPARPRRRLFVDRGPMRSRGLSNGEQVFEALRPFGFERVRLDALGFAAQVAIFAGAEMVVGNMGAGMTNTLVCRPGTTVIHLAPEGWTEPFYWDLAAVMGHRYHAVYGPSEGDPFVEPFRVETSDVIGVVSRYFGEGG